jgi:hypothetical protein
MKKALGGFIAGSILWYVASIILEIWNNTLTIDFAISKAMPLLISFLLVAVVFLIIKKKKSK